MANPGILIGVASVVISTTAHSFLKAGASDFPKLAGGLGWNNLAPMVTNPFIAYGVILHMLALLVWMAALSRLELSVAYPLLALGYPLVLVSSYFIFNEPLTLERIAGVFLIGAGVLLISSTA